jgi:hypothetical protein
MTLTARFVLRQDTFGLRADVAAYAKFFPRHTVVVHGAAPALAPASASRVDVTVHLEFVNEAYARLSTANLLMVNHEYFGLGVDLAFMQRQLTLADVVLVKTQAGMRLLRALSASMPRRRAPALVYTKHTTLLPPSSAPLQAGMDFGSVLHFAGRSNWKQTDAVLNAWVGHPELPHLCIVCHSSCHASLRKYASWTGLGGGTAPTYASWTGLGGGTPQANLTYVNAVMGEAEMWALKRSRGVHLCPSIVEGYGHYINEARALGAFVVTVDAAPMNELIDGSCGSLIPCDATPSKPRTFALPNAGVTMCIVSPARIRSAIRQLFLATSTPAMARKGRLAHARFSADTAFFASRMRSVVAALEAHASGRGRGRGNLHVAARRPGTHHERGQGRAGQGLGS